jgi:hypothetical protein
VSTEPAAQGRCVQTPRPAVRGRPPRRAVRGVEIINFEKRKNLTWHQPGMQASNKPAAWLKLGFRDFKISKSHAARLSRNQLSSNLGRVIYLRYHMTKAPKK